MSGKPFKLIFQQLLSNPPTQMDLFNMNSGRMIV